MEYKVYAAIRFIVKCIAVMNIRLLIGTNNLASDGAYMNATGRGKSVAGRYMNHGYGIMVTRNGRPGSLIQFIVTESP